MNRSKKKYRIKSPFKFTVSVTATMVCILLISALVLGFNHDAEGLSKQQYIQVEVQSGDTLWTIARKHMPENVDTRKSVHIIKKVNDTSAYELQPGQILDIPVET